MRKVNLTVTATIMVPITVTYTVVAKAEEVVSMEQVARGAIAGTVSHFIDYDDSAISDLNVTNAPNIVDLHDQVVEYIESPDSPTPKYVSHEVLDSR